MGDLAGTERIEVAAPAGALWRLRWDFSRLPEYNPDVSRVRLTRGAPEGEAGAMWEFVLAGDHGSHGVTLEVTESVPDRLVVASMRGALSAHERFEIEAAGPTACRATLTLWMDLPAQLEASARQVLLAGGRRQIRQELDAMARLLAGGNGAQIG